MKETTGWKKENPGSKKAREAGAFSGNRNSALPKARHTGARQAGGRPGHRLGPP